MNQVAKLYVVKRFFKIGDDWEMVELHLAAHDTTEAIERCNRANMLNLENIKYFIQTDFFASGNFFATAHSNINTLSESEFNEWVYMYTKVNKMYIEMK